MNEHRSSTATSRLAAGVGLAVVGLLLWILAGVAAGHEPRSYQSQSAPPQWVAVTRGQTYSIGTAGGLRALPVDVATLQCQIAVRGAATSALGVSPETNTKALHRIATFVAPVSDDVHVTCPDVGVVYVDDPDGGTDWAGLLRVLASLLLVIGLPLLLSGLAGLREPTQRTVDA